MPLMTMMLTSSNPINQAEKVEKTLLCETQSLQPYQKYFILDQDTDNDPFVHDCHSLNCGLRRIPISSLKGFIML